MFKKISSTLSSADASQIEALEQTISDQNRKLSKYEKKLKDLIVAYRSVCEERDTLKIVVASFDTSDSNLHHTDSSQDNVPNDQTPEASLEVTGAPVNDIDDVETASNHSETSIASENVTDRQKSQGDERVATLTAAFNKLSREKSRLEEAYIADKKLIKAEHEALVGQLQERIVDLETSVEEYENSTSDLKQRLREMQRDLDSQNETNSIMLKELQNLLSEARQKGVDYQKQISSLESTLTHERNLKNEALKYQAKVAQLERELEDVIVRLKKSEDKSKETPPLLQELQKELNEMKAMHKVEILAEQKKALEADARANRIQEASENRISSLESKVSEFTETLSRYEHMKLEHIQCIDALKDRVAQLDLENSLLSQAVGREPEDSNLTVEALESKYNRYKELYAAARLKAGLSSELPQSFGDEVTANLHEKCNAELSQLKDEFEKYKMRAQNLLRSKTNRDTDSELEKEREASNQLRRLLSQKSERINELEQKVEESKSNLDSHIKVVRREHANELQKLRAEHRVELKQLEDSVSKHRERTAELLSEKDKEIEDLRALNGDNQNTTNEPVFTSEDTSFSNSFHVRELISHKDVELARAKKEKSDIEVAMRELQDSFMMKEMKLEEKIERMAQELERFQRRAARENSNIEYLKNVTLQYLLTTEYSARSSMLEAIMNVLQFTTKEMQAVRKSQHNLGWLYSGR